MKVDLADSMVVDNEDIIDEEGKKVYTGHTVEIGVCAKPRLMPSNHLTCHFVILPPSLEYHIRMAVILLFAHAYAYTYNSPHVSCHPTPLEREIKYLPNPIIAWLGTAV